jgi:hypothetical protein
VLALRPTKATTIIPSNKIRRSIFELFRNILKKIFPM